MRLVATVLVLRVALFHRRHVTYIDVTWFPFDRQTCHVTYESYSYSVTEVNLTMEEGFVAELHEYYNTGEWELYGTYTPSFSIGQLSLLPSAGREVSTNQSAVMLCGWGVKAGMVHSTCE